MAIKAARPPIIPWAPPAPWTVAGPGPVGPGGPVSSPGAGPGPVTPAIVPPAAPEYPLTALALLTDLTKFTKGPFEESEFAALVLMLVAMEIGRARPHTDEEALAKKNLLDRIAATATTGFVRSALDKALDKAEESETLVKQILDELS